MSIHDIYLFGVRDDMEGGRRERLTRALMSGKAERPRKSISVRSAGGGLEDEGAAVGLAEELEQEERVEKGRWCLGQTAAGRPSRTV